MCAISGGVDSAVAAALLIKRGYEVTGGFIKCFTDPITGPACWLNEKRDAMRVCAKLGIKLMIFDFEKEYRKAVVDYIYREYKAGRTPNPDVMCNKYVKFPLLIREAKKLGFDYIATGHYARLGREILNPKSEIRNKSKIPNTKYKIRLLAAVDENKDQTYFLHQLKQKELQQVLFPIGDYTKPQVRELAKKFNLPVAQKEESMGICFIGEVPLRQFLSKKIKPRKGKIVLSNGTVVGEHTGLPFYTIGQRIGVSFPPPICRPRECGDPVEGRLQRESSDWIPNRVGNDNDTKPFYVVAKDKKKNQIIVANENSPLLYKKEIIVQKVNWIAGQPPELPLTCFVRLRHRQPLQRCRIRNNEPAYRTGRLGIRVDFVKPQRAVAPGQFAVFYLPCRSSGGAKEGKNNECLGGGEIK